jgi:hypothetical protein
MPPCRHLASAELPLSAIDAAIFADTPPLMLTLRAPLPPILRQLFAAAFDDYAIIADFR